MVQRLKRGHGFAASYKPSVLANPDRIITAFEIDPSSETKVIAPMLDQSARVTGEGVRELLLDAGYFDDQVIEATLTRQGSEPVCDIKLQRLQAACELYEGCAGTAHQTLSRG